MTNPQDGLDPVQAIAQLDEPNRRRLYDLVVGSGEPVGRDEAAGSLRISRELAAFHLDRLVEAGLLETEFRRRGGRTGPGAGRPAKFYRRARREVTISLPPRTYDAAADVMASAFERLAGTPANDALTAVAHERGVAAGKEARRKASPRPGRRRLEARLLDVLGAAGYEPEVDRSSGTVTLRNCPFDSLAANHRALTCGMNLAWAQGLVGGLGDSNVAVELAPEAGRCCVLVHTAPGVVSKATGVAPGRTST
jgi:predicted ArsR family transcriptional regulator